MKRDFLKRLQEGWLLGDGAMGTQIYAGGIGINRCFDELCVSNPALIRSIHASYIEAGAEVLETNSFTANRLALAAFGFESRVSEINRAAAMLAREAAGEQRFVVGAVGPISWTKKDAEMMKPGLMCEVFSEQIAALAAGGVDAIMLETFTHLDELRIAFETARATTHLPIICQVTLKYAGEGEFEGLQPEDAAKNLERWGADVIGVNCSDGPQGVFEAVKKMAEVTTRPLSAFPNAGLPKMVQGRLFYMATPQYFAEYAKHLAQLGVALIGGCCGTGPAHIRQMRNFLKSVHVAGHVAGAPRPSIEIKSGNAPLVPSLPPAEKSFFGSLLGKKFAVSVEIEPPASVKADEAIEGAKLLKSFGVDVVNISDGPRAMARMSATALAVLIQQHAGMETIIHCCCRDRNLLGLQMDLLGAAALSIKNLMLITGDPPKMGHYPEATAVFDVDAIGLIRFAAQLNRGLDFAGRPIKEATKFVIGCGCNPGAVDLDLEVERFSQKIAAGAEYVFSQPVYEPKLLETFLQRIRHLPRIPFFVGVLPLSSLRNAEFLHNEVPGMQVPKGVMERMAKASSQEAQREVGITVAREMLSFAKTLDGVQGIYVFPPFRNYAAVERLLEVIR